MGDSRFTVDDFFIITHLDDTGFGGEEVEKIILSEQEKEDAKYVLKGIGEYIEENKKDFETVFNIGPYDKYIEFVDFKNALEYELDAYYARLSGDFKTMYILKNYLLDKSNMEGQITVPILKSEIYGTEDIPKEIKSQLNCITDFAQFLKDHEEIKLEDKFKEQMKHDEFKEVLEEIEYEIPEKRC
jgi:hypothetical protein